MIGFIGGFIGGIIQGVIVRLCVLAIIVGAAVWWFRSHA